MKTKVKFISVMAVVFCLFTACVGLLSACGGEEEQIVRDYENYTYNDWAAIPQTEWDSKTVQYQLYTGDDGGNIVMCFNLYDDGTLACWEVGMYVTDPDAMPDAAWVNEEKHIMWDFYGFWEEEGDTVKLYYICKLSAADQVVEKRDDFLSRTAFTFYLPITNKTITQDLDNLQNPTNLLYLGVNTQGQIWPMGGTSDGEPYDLVSGSDIRYATFQAFLDSYIDGFFPPL